MCGIAGIFAYRTNGSPLVEDELRKCRDAMALRGPDGQGEWFSADKSVGLAHRRLAIIDLSEGGAQPMVDEATGCVLVFNGEIYNHLELRRDLEARGHRFRSSSDTEVVLRAYIEHGEAMLPSLRGMFAIAVWDPRRRGMLLARDPLGIKPLYIADDGGTIRFASQVKALLAGGGIKDTRIDPAGRVGFYLWGSVPSPFTFYRSIRILNAGAAAWVDERGVSPERRFFRLEEEFARAESGRGEPIDAAEAEEELRAALADSVRSHLIADVPVGVFLSSGIDSTAIAALAVACGVQSPLRTLTLAFDEFKGTEQDESPLAGEVAALLGTRHSVTRISKDEFLGFSGSIFDAMDQPSIDGVNTYLVCRMAREAGLKVVLSGLGGDELFRGYSNFRLIPNQLRWTRFLASLPGLGRTMRTLAGPLARTPSQAKAASIVEFGADAASAYLLRRALVLPWELDRYLPPEVARDGLERLDPLGQLRASIHGISDLGMQLAALETRWYMRNQLLRDSDWASMAHSIELRVPLVDTHLLRSVLSLVARGFTPSKLDASHAASPRIFEVLRARPKTGFAIPARDWLTQSNVAATSTGGAMRDWAKVVEQRCTVVPAVQSGAAGATAQASMTPAAR